MVLKGDREFQMRKVCRSGQVVSLPAEERRKSVATASGLLPKTGRANPLLSKEGQARSAGVVCSKSRSHVIDAREALLINRYCSTLNRPPQPSLREGIPALLRRGIVRSIQQCLVLFFQRLRVRFAVWIEQFFAPFLPGGFE